MANRVPNFIIAGPPRSGTGWMMSCLAEHPEVFIPEKEVNYFSSEYDRSPSWYRNHFEDCSPGQKVGEKSPSYFSSSDAAARIHQWNPGVELVFSLRHPIERAFAIYCMALRREHVSEDVKRELAPGSWLAKSSRYFEQLKPYRKRFSEEQLHVLIFDDLKADPRKFARGLFNTAGVDPDFEPSILGRKFGHRKKRGGAFWSRIRKLSISLAQSSDIINRLIQWFRRRGYTEYIHRLRSGKEDPSLPAVTRRELQDYYSDDVNRLRSYLDRDLSDWPG